MGFDLEELRRAVTQHGRVSRVVIAAIRGSSPREVGTAMLVWQGGSGLEQSGTIGGGALEYEAAQAALRQQETGVTSQLYSRALGPDLGQCCGGAVTLLSEVYDKNRLAELPDRVIARAVTPAQAAMPMTIKRLLKEARNQGQSPAPILKEGWMVEPVLKPDQPLWIWGAGHVGRALVDVLAPIPNFDITWIDTTRSRFPDAINADVSPLWAAEPEKLVPHAPSNAAHLVLTYSHELDLALCHALLTHGFGFAGLIGSATKWARFRSRLGALGHGPHQIGRITCPIGDPSLGKHPQMIAVGVAGELLKRDAWNVERKDRHA